MGDDGEDEDFEYVDFDDGEYLYFDFAHNREFDDATKRLIDQIAHDPRFTLGANGKAIAREWAGNIDDERFLAIEGAAYSVYQATVGAELTSAAEVHVARALADPAFDALSTWSSEDSAEEYFEKALPTDPRLRDEVRYRLAQDPVFLMRQETARRELEEFAAQLASELSQRERDALVLMTRNADREALVSARIGVATSRRRGWTAYYVQRIVREREETNVLDRYSCAVKVLTARGLSKAKIASVLALTTSRVDRLLERPTWRELDRDDPLLVLAPVLREPVPILPLSPSSKPKSFSRMTVAEREALAMETTDPVMLERLAAQASRRVSEALLQRHVHTGDLTDDLLYPILTAYPSPWLRDEFAAANRERALPPRTALELAATEPWTLLEGSDETAKRAAALSDDRYSVVLAMRDENVDGLTQTLQLPEQAPGFQLLVQLLVERPIATGLRSSVQFLDALLAASDRAADPIVATSLRLAACQNSDVLADHLRAAAQTGSARMDPTAIVTVALGPYFQSGQGGREVVREIATQLWTGADLTVEHSLARTVIADRGTDRVVVRTKLNTYVATADAIRCYPNTEETGYTYVHLHLTAARNHHIGPIVIRTPGSLPALGYHREVGKHPSRPDGDDIRVIVWPLPLQPAIYSLDTSLSDVAAYIAVAQGKVTVVDDLE